MILFQGLYYNTRACDLGYATGCVEAARVHLHGHLHCKELARDAVKALSFLKRACSGGIFSACHVAGDMYLKGDGCEKDEELAKKYFEAAELGRPTS